MEALCAEEDRKANVCEEKARALLQALKVDDFDRALEMSKAGEAPRSRNALFTCSFRPFPDPPFCAFFVSCAFLVSFLPSLSFVVQRAFGGSKKRSFDEKSVGRKF